MVTMSKMTTKNLSMKQVNSRLVRPLTPLPPALKCLQAINSTVNSTQVNQGQGPFLPVGTGDSPAPNASSHVAADKALQLLSDKDSVRSPVPGHG